MHSVGFLNKNWDDGYAFNAVFSRLENFQSVEKQIVNPDTGATQLVRDAVQIRKLPEAEFSSRDRQLWRQAAAVVFLRFRRPACCPAPSRSSIRTVTQLIDRFRPGRS